MQLMDALLQQTPTQRVWLWHTVKLQALKQKENNLLPISVAAALDDCSAAQQITEQAEAQFPGPRVNHPHPEGEHRETLQ